MMFSIFRANGLFPVTTMAVMATGVDRYLNHTSHGERSNEIRVDENTVDDLQKGLATGRFTSEQLVNAYLTRISNIDSSGPSLNSIIELNPVALSEAKVLDEERKNGFVRSNLHGIPILLKDNIATLGPMETTAGSLALLGLRPNIEAPIVTKLKDAGVVILGKTNCSEWANYRSSNSASGWSGRGGQTRNPYALDRSPSGSSSGAGAATAANLCAVSIGTETNGSIVSPAAACGLVGLKPTVGLVHRGGIIPISKSQDTAGPMARTVRDAALVMDVIVSPDAVDADTLQPPEGFNWTQRYSDIKPGALRGTRVGLIRKPLSLHPRMEAVISEAKLSLRKAGAEVVEVDVPEITPALAESVTVMSYEFKEGINNWLANLQPESALKTIEDIIEFNETNRELEMPYFGQDRMIEASRRGPTTDKEYKLARQRARELARRGVDGTLAAHGLDALVALTAGPACLIDPIYGDQRTGGSSTLAAVAGYPSITVPTAQVYGLPVGLSFIGAAWEDAKLISLAADYEAHTHARRPPTFAATAHGFTD